MSLQQEPSAANWPSRRFFEPKSFNPITSSGTFTSEITPLIHESLIRINGVTSRPEPNLAKSWDISEDSLTWTFHIREGVLWSDSIPFSAYDIEFTFNDLIYNDEIIPNVIRDLFTINGSAISVKALDSLSVVFSLPAPLYYFLQLMSQGILPKHKYSLHVKKGSFKNVLGITTPPDSITGTGPFLLESCIPSQKIILKRNPLYWKKRCCRKFPSLP